MTRVLALDPGERRIGVALSDPTGTIAQPHTVIDRKTENFADRLRDLCAAYGVELIVVGLPVTLAGNEGEAARAARGFGDRAAAATGLPVVFSDERFTTVTAENALLEGGVRRRKRRDVRDMVAASVLLQSYLDAEKHRQDGSEH